MIQIFVTVDGSKSFPLMVSLSDKVDDVMRRIVNNEKSNKSVVYLTCEGRVLRWSDELRSSGVRDGSTVQIMNMTRAGGKHRNKKNIAEKKTTTSPKNQESRRGQQEHDGEKIIHNSEPEQRQQESKKDRRMLSRQNAEDEVVRHCDETGGLSRTWQEEVTGTWKS